MKRLNVIYYYLDNDDDCIDVINDIEKREIINVSCKQTHMFIDPIGWVTVGRWKPKKT